MGRRLSYISFDLRVSCDWTNSACCRSHRYFPFLESPRKLIVFSKLAWIRAGLLSSYSCRMALISEGSEVIEFAVSSGTRLVVVSEL